jgi:catechol 2,3-dioxygenase-like lactoylglutathione lyase family enzyme
MKTFGSATTFHVSDLDASLKYYTEVLGFSERFRFGDYAGVEYQDIQIHLSGPKATNKKAVGQSGIYIFCDDVDAYYTEVTAKGAKAQAAPKDYDYGMRDFVIEDPDANLIGIGQETPNGNPSPAA